MDYNREHNLKIKIVRIFNTYGPNMSYNDGRVVSNFITQAIENREITINGDGRQTRSFQYVDDLIEAMIKFMKTSDDFTGPLNVGNPEEISIKSLAKIILELTNSHSKISFNNLPEDDPMMRNPDITLAKNKLDWSPKVNLKDGLIKLLNILKQVDCKIMKVVVTGKKRPVSFRARVTKIKL